MQPNGEYHNNNTTDRNDGHLVSRVIVMMCGLRGTLVGDEKPATGLRRLNDNTYDGEECQLWALLWYGTDATVII